MKAAFFLLSSIVSALLALPVGESGAVAVDLTPASSGNIYTWAENTDKWNHTLHVSGYRIGCAAGDTVRCFNEGLTAAGEGHIGKIIVSMELDPKRAASDALVYSQLSLSHPSLVEVTFDDFVDRYGLMLARENTVPISWLQTVIQNVKAMNPALQFGITLYEDELQSPYLKAPYLSSAVGKSVDDVHLYIHYRQNAQNFPSYVQQTKALFPNAKIIAGSYAYDRVNYIPCTPSGKELCTPEQDVALYEQSIAIEAQMLKSGDIAGIEFYPGFFGMEKQWQGWKEPDYCDRARLQQCVENTLKMREAAAASLRSTMNW